MLATAPLSVLLLGVLGMLIVAFAVARMTVLERRHQVQVMREPSPRSFARTTV